MPCQKDESQNFLHFWILLCEHFTSRSSSFYQWSNRILCEILFSSSIQLNLKSSHLLIFDFQFDLFKRVEKFLKTFCESNSLLRNKICLSLLILTKVLSFVKKTKVTKHVHTPQLLMANWMWTDNRIKTESFIKL